MPQLQNWSVCQICGRQTRRGTAGWLDEPYKKDPSIRMVRCPDHITDHALQYTVGRSQEARHRALAGRQNLPPVRVFDPFVFRDDLPPVGIHSERRLADDL